VNRKERTGPRCCGGFVEQWTLGVASIWPRRESEPPFGSRADSRPSGG